MRTVAETELQQRMSDFILFVREYSVLKGKEFKVTSKREGALLLCVDGEVTLDFKV